jgi:hypothetical protein
MQNNLPPPVVPPGVLLPVGCLAVQTHANPLPFQTSHTRLPPRGCLARTVVLTTSCPSTSPIQPFMCTPFPPRSSSCQHHHHRLWFRSSARARRLCHHHRLRRFRGACGRAGPRRDGPGGRTQEGGARAHPKHGQQRGGQQGGGGAAAGVCAQEGPRRVMRKGQAGKDQAGQGEEG